MLGSLNSVGENPYLSAPDMTTPDEKEIKRVFVEFQQRVKALELQGVPLAELETPKFYLDQASQHMFAGDLDAAWINIKPDETGDNALGALETKYAGGIQTYDPKTGKTGDSNRYGPSKPAPLFQNVHLAVWVGLGAVALVGVVAFSRRG